MAKTLIIATAGLRPDQLEDIGHARYPRVDYHLLQKYLDVDVLDYTAYNRTRLGALFRWFETKVRSDLYLVFLATILRRKYSLIFTMSERAGIPYSGVQKIAPLHNRFITMFQCWSKRQEWVTTNLALFPAMDQIIVHCQNMKDHLIELGAPEERTRLIHYGIDHKFFTPRNKENCHKKVIMSIGEVRSRDYPTFFEAVRDLPVEVNVAASGAWYARENKRRLSITPPENVSLTGRLSQLEIRDLYANSNFVVLPVRDLPYSAGATGILEAGCMARAVIVTRSPGIADYVIDGETGIMVDHGDVQGYRRAVEYLLFHPEEAERMGLNARQRVEEELNLDIYVRELSEVLSRIG